MSAAGATLFANFMNQAQMENARMGQHQADHQARAAWLEQQSRNRDMQEEFAKNGIQWRVADARAAGISPLMALGAQIPTYQPGATISDGGGGSTEPDYLGFLGQMGQNIAGAAAMTMTAEEKEFQTMQMTSMKLDLQGKEIDNAIRLSQLQKLNAGPSFPSEGGNFIPGQGNTAPVRDVPLSRTMGTSGSEMGAIVDTGWASTSDGALVPIPSKDVKERIEDNLIQETMHAVRNNLVPNIGGGPRPPDSALPKGAKGWTWDYFKQGYVPDFGYDRSSVPWDYVKKNWNRVKDEYRRGGR